MKGRILFDLAKSKVCSGRGLYSMGLALSPEGGLAQSEIQKGEVKGLPAYLGHRVGRVAFSDHPVAFFLQAGDQGLADIVLVIHYENLEGIGEAIRVIGIVIQRKF
jgi:hypothetical protein